jgi:hypothetical protein
MAAYDPTPRHASLDGAGVPRPTRFAAGRTIDVGTGTIDSGPLSLDQKVTITSVAKVNAPEFLNTMAPVLLIDGLNTLLPPSDWS